MPLDMPMYHIQSELIEDIRIQNIKFLRREQNTIIHFIILFVGDSIGTIPSDMIRGSDDRVCEMLNAPAVDGIENEFWSIGVVEVAGLRGDKTKR